MLLLLLLLLLLQLSRTSQILPSVDALATHQPPYFAVAFFFLLGGKTC